MRSWSIEIWLVDSAGNDMPATCFEKAVYNLHPSFEKNKQTFKKPPFKIEEKGWGEFDMTIVLTGAHKGGDHTLAHDLNFQSEKYEATHVVVSACFLGGGCGGVLMRHRRSGTRSRIWSRCSSSLGAMRTA